MLAFPRARSAGAVFLLLLAALLSCAAPRGAAASPGDVVTLVSRLAGADPSLAARFAAPHGGFGAGDEGVVSPGWRAEGRRSLRSRVAPDARGAWEIYADRGGEAGVRLSPEGAAPVPLAVHEGRAVYRDVRPSTDIVVVAGETYAELAYVLRDEAAPAEASFAVELGAGIARVASNGRGGISFVDGAGKARLAMARPFALDAEGRRRDADLAWDAASRRLSIRLDTRGLAFPVLLDPPVETVTWEQNQTTAAPEARNFHAMAELASKVVLFGGLLHQGMALETDDTWTWDGTAWNEATPAQSPPPRASHAMATLGGKVVLFGGSNRITPSVFDDTWTWDGTSWAQASPAQSPPARTNFAMAALGNVVVLFGGNGVNGPGSLGDTWTWDGTTWTQASPAVSPPARAFHTMAALDGKIVLFGGTGANGQALGDTWTWDGTSWAQASPAVSPPARTNHMMAARAGRVVLFGGDTPATAQTFGDTWEWDGTTWTQTSPIVSPSPRDFSAMATLGSSAILFSGTDIYAPAGDTWTYGGGVSQGGTCASAADCTSGFCVDGVCCATACGSGAGGDCQACSVAAGASADGTCTTLPSCTPVMDGGSGSDGGTGGSSSGTGGSSGGTAGGHSGGCAFRVAERDAGPSAVLGLALAAVVLAARRRRER